MQQRPWGTLASLCASCLFFATGAQAEVLCPTSFRLDAPGGTSVTVGPTGQYKSAVTAQLTATQEVCSVVPSNAPRIQIVHKAVKLPGNDTTKYFDHVWEEISDPLTKLIDGKPKKAAPTQVTTAAVLTHGAYPGAPATGLKVVFECAANPPLTVNVSAPNWTSSNAQIKGVDVSIKEVASLRGTPRLFDVTCVYEYPQVVYVSFPRQTRADNRDISVNLNKTGFYRVYDMNKSIWGNICEQTCRDSVSQYRGSAEGLGAYITQCRNTCVNKGW